MDTIATRVRFRFQFILANRWMIASVLADGLSKVLKEQLLVASAEFVEPNKSELYQF